MYKEIKAEMNSTLKALHLYFSILVQLQFHISNIVFTIILHVSLIMDNALWGYIPLCKLLWMSLLINIYSNIFLMSLPLIKLPDYQVNSVIVVFYSLYFASLHMIVMISFPILCFGNQTSHKLSGRAKDNPSLSLVLPLSVCSLHRNKIVVAQGVWETLVCRSANYWTEL